MKTISKTLWISGIMGLLTGAHLGASEWLRQSPEYLYPELREILKKAESNAFAVEQLSVQAAKAQLAKEAAYSDKKPYVSFGTGVGFAGDSINNGLQTSINDLALGMSYSLYQWGAKEAGHLLAENQFELQEISYEETLSRFGREVRENYLNLILDHFNLKALELETSIVHENLEQDTLKWEEGRLSNEAYQRIVNSRKIRLMDLEQARISFERRLEDFRIHTGIKDFNRNSIPSTIPVITNINPVLEKLAAEAKAKNFASVHSMRRAETTIDNAEQYIVQAKASMRPSLSLYARATMNPELSQNNDLVLKYSGGVGLNWNIYSGGRNEKMLERTYFDRRVELAGKMNLMVTVENSINRLLQDLSYQANRLSIRELEYQMALASFEKSKDEYARGRLSELEFLHVELNRLNEEKLIFSSRRDYLMSVSSFLSFIGMDPVLDIFTSFEERARTILKS
jgi:outer membrane protein